jgi:hypothetical protein
VGVVDDLLSCFLSKEPYFQREEKYGDEIGCEWLRFSVAMSEMVQDLM